MSFPFEAQMVYGHEKLQSATKEMPLGTIGVLPDGRKFRYAQAGTASYLQPCYGVAADMTFVNSATATAGSAIGDYTVTVTTEEDVAENLFEDGYLVVSNGTEKYPIYKIKSHPAANSASCVITLWEPVVTGRGGAGGITTSETVTLLKNPYKGVKSVRGEGAPGYMNRHSWVGVAIRTPSTTASYYCWVQVEGLCMLSGYDNVGASVNETTAYFWQDGSIRICTTALGLVEGRQLAGVVAPCSHSSKGDEDLPGAMIPIFLTIPH